MNATIPNTIGASAGHETPKSYVDLATVAEVLLKAVQSCDPQTSAFHVGSNGCHVSFSTASVMKNVERLLKDKNISAIVLDEKRASAHGDRDRAHVGARIKPGTHHDLTRLIDGIFLELDRQIVDGAASGDIGNLKLLYSHAEECFDEIQSRIKTPQPRLRYTANAAVATIAIADGEQNVKASQLGRMFIAKEIRGGIDVKGMLSSAIKRNSGEGKRFLFDEDQVVSILRVMEQPRGRNQLDALEKWLDDVVMGRARLQVSLSILAAVTKAEMTRYVKPGNLARYVRAIENLQRLCFAHDTSQDAVEWDDFVNVSAFYGDRNNFCFLDEMALVRNYDALPIWFKPHAQMYEFRGAVGDLGECIEREISYRLRSNGMVPGKNNVHAFDERIASIRSRLLRRRDDKGFMAKRELVQMLLLDVIIPQHRESPVDAALEDFDDFVIRLKCAINDMRSVFRKSTEQGVDEWINDRCESLGKRKSIVDDMAASIRSALRTDASCLFIQNHVNESISVQRVYLMPDLIDEGNAPVGDIFVDKDKPHLWLHHARIRNESPHGTSALQGCGQRLESNALLSYAVRNEISLRSVHISANEKNGGFRQYKLERACSGNTGAYFYARITPEGRIKQGHPQRRRGVDVVVANMPDQYKESQGLCDIHNRHRRAFWIIAHSLLIYIGMHLLRKHANAGAPSPENVRMAILRVQDQGKQAGVSEANDSSVMYAIMHAVEVAIGRMGPVRMQGYVANEDKTSQYRQIGAMAALLAGQGMKMPMQGNLDKIALVVYHTRECESMPGDGLNMHLFQARIYTMRRLQGADKDCGIVSMRRMRSHILEGDKDIKNPEHLRAIIAALMRGGYKHVMLLSQNTNARHIGRAAEHNALHASSASLREWDQQFGKSMSLYVLRRDICPVFRMRKRSWHEGGFEITDYEKMRMLVKNRAATTTRQVIPVYSFATFDVVGSESAANHDRPNSGLCTYFMDEDIGASSSAQRLASANMLGTGGNDAQEARQSLIGMLRGLHWLEGEKAANKNGFVLPVLDPYSWLEPDVLAHAGIIEMDANHGKKANVNLTACLTRVAEVLHRYDESVLSSAFSHQDSPAAKKQAQDEEIMEPRTFA